MKELIMEKRAKDYQPRSFVLAYEKEQGQDEIELSVLKKSLDNEFKYKEVLVYKSDANIWNEPMLGDNKDFYYLAFIFDSRQKLTINIETKELIYPKYYSHYTYDSAIVPKLIDSHSSKTKLCPKIDLLSEALNSSDNYDYDITLLETFSPPIPETKLEDHFFVIIRLQTLETFHDYIREKNLFFFLDTFISKLKAIENFNTNLKKESIKPIFNLPPFVKGLTSDTLLKPSLLEDNKVSLPSVKPDNKLNFNKVITTSATEAFEKFVSFEDNRSLIMEALKKDNYKDKKIQNFIFSEDNLSQGSPLLRIVEECRLDISKKHGKISNGIKFISHHTDNSLYKKNKNEYVKAVLEFLPESIKQQYINN